MTNNYRGYYVFNNIMSLLNFNDLPNLKCSMICTAFDMYWYTLFVMIMYALYILELLIITDVRSYAGSNSTATVSIISGTVGSLLVVALLVCGILIIVIVILRKKGNTTIPTYKGI